MKVRPFFTAMIQVAVVLAPAAVRANDWPPNIKRIYIKGHKHMTVYLHDKAAATMGIEPWSPNELDPGQQLEINLDDYDAVKIAIPGKPDLTIDKNTSHFGRNYKWWDFNGWDIWINDNNQFDSDLHHF